MMMKMMNIAAAEAKGKADGNSCIIYSMQQEQQLAATDIQQQSTVTSSIYSYSYCAIAAGTTVYGTVAVLSYSSYC
eukprot:3819-Heterococcus_DN1.PRE.2